MLLTSVLKNTGDAVVEIVKSSIDGTFDNAPFIGTLENGGVDIAPFHDLASRVTPELQAEIDAADGRHHLRRDSSIDEPISAASRTVDDASRHVQASVTGCDSSLFRRPAARRNIR